MPILCQHIDKKQKNTYKIHVELERLRFQNPQWDNINNFQNDPILLRLKQAQKILKNPVQEKIKLEKERVYILRGPRQIGKTTLVKTIIENLLLEGTNPFEIFYFALDIGGLRNEEEVFDLLLSYINIAKGKKAASQFIFLDEATYIRDWQLGIKKAYDSGILKNAFLLVTGSSSIELHKGGERLPGRRGPFASENDLEMFPLSFREYIKNLAPQIELPEPLEKEHFNQELVYKNAEKLSYFNSELQSFLEKYVKTGGLPLSIVDFLKNEEDKISPEPYYVYLQATLGDILKSGKNERYLREILYSILAKRFEPLDAHLISKETSIGSHNTVSSYLEVLEGLYITKTIYQVRNLDSSLLSFKKRKKIYFIDPLIFHTLRAWVNGAPNAFDFCSEFLKDPSSKARLNENIVGIHFINYYKNVSFWRNRSEIDFICSYLGKPEAYIEVKYQALITDEDRKGLKKAGGGILLTKESLSQGKNNIVEIPLHLFLPQIE